MESNNESNVVKLLKNKSNNYKTRVKSLQKWSINTKDL